MSTETDEIMSTSSTATDPASPRVAIVSTTPQRGAQPPPSAGGDSDAQRTLVPVRDDGIVASRQKRDRDEEGCLGNPITISSTDSSRSPSPSGTRSQAQGGSVDGASAEAGEEEEERVSVEDQQQAAPTPTPPQPRPASDAQDDHSDILPDVAALLEAELVAQQQLHATQVADKDSIIAKLRGSLEDAQEMAQAKHSDLEKQLAERETSLGADLVRAHQELAAKEEELDDAKKEVAQCKSDLVAQEGLKVAELADKDSVIAKFRGSLEDAQEMAQAKHSDLEKQLAEREANCFLLAQDSAELKAKLQAAGETHEKEKSDAAGILDAVQTEFAETKVRLHNQAGEDKKTIASLELTIDRNRFTFGENLAKAQHRDHETLSARLSDQEGQLVELRAELENGKKETMQRHADSKSAFEDQETLLVEKENELIQKDSVIAQLQGSLEEMTQDHEKELAKQQESLSADLVRALQESKDLKAELETARETHEKEKSDSKSAFEAQHMVLVDTENELATVLTELVARGNQLSDSKKEATGFKSSLETQQKLHTTQQAEKDSAIEQLRVELDAVQRDMATAKADSDKLLSSVKKLLSVEKGKVTNADNKFKAAQMRSEKALAEKKDELDGLRELRNVLAAQVVDCKTEAALHKESALAAQEQLQAEMDQLKNTLATRGAELESARKSCEEARAQLDVQCEEYADLQTESTERLKGMQDELDNTNAQLSKTQAEMEGKFQKHNEYRDKCQQELVKKVRELGTSKTELDAKKLELAKKDGDLNTEKCRTATLQGELETKKCELDEAKSQFLSQGVHLTTALDSSTQLKTQLEDLQAQLSTSKKELADSNAKKKQQALDLELSLDALTDADAQGKKNVALRDQQIRRELQETYDELEQKRLTLQERADDVAKAEKALRESKVQQGQLEASIKKKVEGEFKQQMADLQGRVDNQKQTNRELNNWSRDKWKEYTTQLAELREALTQTLAELSEENRRRKKHHAETIEQGKATEENFRQKLKAAKDSKQRTIDDLKKQLSEKNSEIKTLKEDQDQLRLKLDDLADQLLAENAENIPGVGQVGLPHLPGATAATAAAPLEQYEGQQPQPEILAPPGQVQPSLLPPGQLQPPINPPAWGPGVHHGGINLVPTLPPAVTPHNALGGANPAPLGGAGSQRGNPMLLVAEALVSAPVLPLQHQQPQQQPQHQPQQQPQPNQQQQQQQQQHHHQQPLHSQAWPPYDHL